MDVRGPDANGKSSRGHHGECEAARHDRAAGRQSGPAAAACGSRPRQQIRLCKALRPHAGQAAGRRPAHPERPRAGRGRRAGKLRQDLAPCRELRCVDRLADDLDGHHRQARRHRCAAQAAARGVRQRGRDRDDRLRDPDPVEEMRSGAAAAEGAGGVCTAIRGQAAPDHAGLSEGSQPP